MCTPKCCWCKMLPSVELVTCCDPNQLLYLTISIGGRTLHPASTVGGVHWVLIPGARCSARTKIGRGGALRRGFWQLLTELHRICYYRDSHCPARGYFWQKPPVVKSCGIVTVIVRVDRVVAPNRGIVVLIRWALLLRACMLLQGIVALTLGGVSRYCDTKSDP